MSRGAVVTFVGVLAVAGWLVVDSFTTVDSDVVSERQGVENVTLVAPPDARTPSAHRGVEAPPPTVAEFAFAELPIAWNVRAVVQDTSGLPVSGARLTLAPTAPERRRGVPAAWDHLDAHMPSTSATSDALGFVALSARGPRTSAMGLEVTLDAPSFVQHFHPLRHRSSSWIDLGVVTLKGAVEVVGRVTTETGEAISSAHVTSSQWNVLRHDSNGVLGRSHRAEATSDQQGVFHLQALASVQADFKIQGPSSSYSPRPLEMPAEGTLDLGDIVLKSQASWTGTVTVLDPDGHPVEGARLERSTQRKGSPTDADPVFTDAAGVATITSFKRTRSAIHDVIVDGYPPTTASPNRDGPRDVIVNLNEPTARAVQIIEADTGTPLDAISVTAVLDGKVHERHTIPQPLRARDQLPVVRAVDDSSRWTILGEPTKPDNARLRVRVAGRPDTWFPWPENGDTLAVAHPAALTVTVVAPDGAPLPDVEVRISAHSFLTQGVTDTEGRAVFEALPAGRLTVSATPWPFDKAVVVARAAPGEHVETEIVAVVASTLVILAHDRSGAPLGALMQVHDGLEVVHVESPDYVVSGIAYVAPGRYEARGLPAGRYRATWQPGGSVEFDIRNGEHTEASLITRAWSQLTGTVTRDGIPIEGASAHASPFWPDVDPDSFGVTSGTGKAGIISVPLAVKTDASGRWQLDQLVGMEWDLTVSLGDASAVTERITIGYDETLVFEHDLATHPIRGRVESDAGLPLVGATVFATPNGGTTTTDELGRFELPNASPAAELLHVSAAEHALIAPRPLGADRSHEVVVLAEAVSVAYTVEGRLPNTRRLDKPDAPRLRIRVIGADDWIEVLAKRRGPLSLALGRHEIELVVDGVVEDRVEINVVPGGDLSITLTRGALQR